MSQLPGLTYFTFITRRSFTHDFTCVIHLSFQMGAFFFCSLSAITATVEKIWQACQVSPIHPRKWRTRRKQPVQPITQVFPVFFHSAPTRKPWMKTLVGSCVDAPKVCMLPRAHSHSYLYFLYFAFLISSPETVEKGWLFSAAAARLRGIWRRASLQLLDKTLDASDKSNAQPWDCERAAVQPIMQSCAAKNEIFIGSQ